MLPSNKKKLLFLLCKIALCSFVRYLSALKRPEDIFICRIQEPRVDTRNSKRLSTETAQTDANVLEETTGTTSCILFNSPCSIDDLTSRYRFVQKYPHYNSEEIGPSRQNNCTQDVDCCNDIGLCCSCHSMARVGKALFLGDIFGLTHINVVGFLDFNVVYRILK